MAKNQYKSLIFLVGARPNFIKVAPIIRELKRRKSSFNHLLVHTGQHYDTTLSNVFFEQLAMPKPDAHLGVGSGPHGAQTGRILEAFEKYLIDNHPKIWGVVVVGDVNSTMAGALAAVKLGIKVAHVEAGLRSFDRSMPEEINRIVTDSVSDLLLVSETSGLENLQIEGIPETKIRFVGNVMIDTLVHELPVAKSSAILNDLGLDRDNYAYVTIHRPSNVDEPENLERLVDFLLWLTGALNVVLPLHPRTEKKLDEFGYMNRLKPNPSIKLTEPLGYHENLKLLASSKMALTDSGGIQEESSYLGIPCLTLRPNTERPITVSQGTNTIIGEDTSRAKKLVEDVMAGRYKTGGEIPRWDGKAARRIVNALEENWLGGENYIF